MISIRHTHIVTTALPIIAVLLTVLQVFSPQSASATSIGAAKINGGYVSLSQKVVTAVYLSRETLEVQHICSISRRKQAQVTTTAESLPFHRRV